MFGLKDFIASSVSSFAFTVFICVNDEANQCIKVCTHIIRSIWDWDVVTIDWLNCESNSMKCMTLFLWPILCY
jgi:hypothetical protein